MVPELLIVSQEHWCASDLGQEEIEVAVTIHIRGGAGTSDQRRAQVADRLVRHRCESLPLIESGVPEQLRRLFIGLAGIDGIDFTLQMTVGLQQVETTVEVVVQKQDSEAEHESTRGADTLADGLVSVERRIAL